mgnify:CR=1 FL=1
MPYKMVVLDLDDTLLRDDLTISDKTRDALLRAQNEGVRVVLASGRPTGAIWRYAEELEIAKHGGYIISFNGAVVTDCETEKPIFQKALSKEIIHELFDHSVEHGALILSYVDDKIVTPRANEWADVERKLTGMEIRETLLSCDPAAMTFTYKVESALLNANKYETTCKVVATGDN